MSGGRLATGLLGVAAVVYVASRVGTLVPADQWAWISPLDGVFRSGNLAIAVLLAASAARLTGRMLDAPTARGAIRAALRDMVLLLAVTVAVTVAALASHRYDPEDTTPWSITSRTVGAALAGRLNIEVAQNPLGVRADLSSLWVVTVLLQLLAANAVLVLVLRRRPTALAAVAAVAFVGGWAWRVRLDATDGWFAATLSTGAHLDAMAAGVLAVVLARRLPVSAASASGLVGGSALILVGLLLAPDFLSVRESIDVLVGVASLLAGALLVGAYAQPLDRRRLVTQLLVLPDVVRLGALAFLLVGWAPWAVALVDRHDDGQSPWLALAVACGITALAAVGMLLGLMEAEARVSGGRATPARRRRSLFLG